jgi:cell wall-associated NlpC family hydrolase
MPVERRAPRLFIAVLAVPVIVAVYLAAFAGRSWSVVRPLIATLLGITVIGSVYAEEAWRRTPTPRVSPLRAAMVLALGLVVVAAGLPGAPTRAHAPSEEVIEIAQSYLGTPYRLGATGPSMVDCSGLMYRIFLDAGELPRIGGKRLRAIGYYNWFKARGMISTDRTAGERGDLVYYKRPNSSWSHIGIYLGNGRVLSALTNGVSVHPIHALQSKFVAFLKVNWSEGDGEPRSEPKRNRDRDRKPDRGGDQGNGEDNSSGPSEGPQAGPNNGPDALPRALATGTMNLRQAADPHGRIIGWVSRGSTFAILGTGNSPSGALWYNVKLRNGRTGWVYSRWVTELRD